MLSFSGCVHNVRRACGAQRPRGRWKPSSLQKMRRRSIQFTEDSGLKASFEVEDSRLVLLEDPDGERRFPVKQSKRGIQSRLAILVKVLHEVLLPQHDVLDELHHREQEDRQGKPPLGVVHHGGDGVVGLKQLTPGPAAKSTAPRRRRASRGCCPAAA